MNMITDAASYRRIAASTTATLCSGPCALLGVMVAGVTTAQFVQIWDGSDATLASGTIVVGTCSLATSAFQRIPAMLTSGLTIQVVNDETDLTFFYKPMGNNT